MKFKKFKKRFLKRVMTRFHMSLILLGTIFSGLLFSKLFLMAGLQNMTIRYILVLISAYLCFFLFIKLWLSYLTWPYRKGLGEDILNSLDMPADIMNISISSPGETFKGGGGDFGGGGASGGWEAASNLAEQASSAAESVGESVADAAGEAVSDLADDGAVVLIPLAILLLIIFGTGTYLIYEVPAILSEAAFEFFLASGLLRRVKKMDKADWAGSVYRSTWLPLAITLVVVIAIAQIVTSYCPSAAKIMDLFDNCLRM